MEGPSQEGIRFLCLVVTIALLCLRCHTKYFRLLSLSTLEPKVKEKRIKTIIQRNRRRRGRFFFLGMGRVKRGQLRRRGHQGVYSYKTVLLQRIFDGVHNYGRIYRNNH